MVDLSALRNAAARDTIVSALSRNPVARTALSPFIGGETISEALSAARAVQLAGMSISVQHLRDPQDREPPVTDHLATIEALAAAGLSEGADLLVDLAALDRARVSDPIGLSADLAEVCAAAQVAGMTVTLAGLAPDQVDTALLLHAALGGGNPNLGLTVSANLLRSEADCGDLARARARVRLVREVPAAEGLAFTEDHDVDKAFVRCTRVLLSEGARPIICTHDPRLVEIATALAVRSDREPDSYSFQFALGVRPEGAADLVSTGMRVSVIVPFGPDWSSYMSRQITVTPRALGRAIRAVVGR